MKRLLLTVALCVAASASFAQKKAVNTAQSLAKSDKPNFEEARSLIKGALTDPESKDDAKTWYVAGFVEDQQFSKERTKQILGQTPDEPVMYEALINVLPYFKKAYELDNLPDAKGKVKPRFVKDMKGILSANHVYYINGGAYYFDQREWRKAFDAFNQYIEIANLPMFVGEPTSMRDSNYMTVQYYAAIASTQLQEPQTAIATLQKATETGYKLNDVYQYLFMEYEMLDDSTNMVKVLKEGIAKVPEESFFMLKLINIYINSGQNEEAIQYLNEAIQKDPNNAQLYDVVGRVYESGYQDYDNAAKYFQKALDIDSNYADAWSNMGRIYYNQAVNKLGEANMINDAKLYQEESQKAKDLFREALPYFEKAHEMNPEDVESMTALRSIYYNLQMGDKFEEMERKMNQ